MLRTWKKRPQTATHRLRILDQLLDDQSAPRGFKKIITPIIPEVTSELSLRWHVVHHKFATELTEHLINYWKKYQERAQTEYDQILRVILTKFSHPRAIS